MIDDEKIIEMFFERSEQGIRELDIKYGKACHNLSYHIVGSRQYAEECVNDAYLGAWNAIPPARPNPLLSYLLKIVRNISLKIYWRKEAAKRSSHYTIALEEIEACIADQKNIEEENGIWARYLGGKNKMDKQNTYLKQTYDIAQVGYDKKKGNWTIGAALDYGTGKDTYANGTGKGKLASLALYGTMQKEDGQ